MRIRWLRAANRNLDAAASYVAKEDPEAAQEMYAHIRRRVAELAKSPELGRPGRVFGTRELVIERYPYIIPYRIRGRELQIIRVFHTSQQLPETW
ncbi:type II toxin-antitoxin system RelE/ParE family toxin [Desulfovibrio sp. OttesenSCG-928-C14]|nr:type II toxin-antitoxin system RelE/ParE family toxin [Desulfovibrio sp. OttesenSCG-928-C14]